MKNVRGIITDEIFLSYLNCKHKSFLKLHGHVGSKTDIEKHQNKLDSEFSLQAQLKLYSSIASNDVLSMEILIKKKIAHGNCLILQFIDQC